MVNWKADAFIRSLYSSLTSNHHHHYSFNRRGAQIELSHGVALPVGERRELPSQIVQEQGVVEQLLSVYKYN